MTLLLTTLNLAVGSRVEGMKVFGFWVVALRGSASGG